MPRRDQLTRAAVLDELERIADTPEMTIVRSKILVHARSSSSGDCPCCGSSTAKIVDEVPDLDLLIDTAEGTRYLRHTFPRPWSLR